MQKPVIPGGIFKGTLHSGIVHQIHIIHTAGTRGIVFQVGPVAAQVKIFRTRAVDLGSARPVYIKMLVAFAVLPAMAGLYDAYNMAAAEKVSNQPVVKQLCEPCLLYTSLPFPWLYSAVGRKNAAKNCKCIIFVTSLQREGKLNVIID